MSSKKSLTTSVILILVTVLAPFFIARGFTAATETLGTDTFAATSFLPPIAEWNQTYGGSKNDYVYSVIQTSDGGYLAAGSTESYGNVAGDVWLVKTDALGNLLWDKEFGGDQYDSAYALRNTNDGGYIIAGTTYSYGAGNGDFWLLRLDSFGNMIWNRTYGGPGEDSAEAVWQTAEGGYVVGGLTDSVGVGGYDAQLLGLDSVGNVMWNKTYGGSDDDEVHAVYQTTDGGYVWAGLTYSFGAGNGDFWLIKTDSTGAIKWDRTFGGLNSDYAYSVQQTTDEGYVVAGFTKSFGAGLKDFWLVRTDWAGNQVWNRTFGGTGDDYANSVIQTGEGGYLLAGYTNSYGAGLEDFWLVRTNSTGNMLWNKTYGKPRSEVAYSVQQTSDKGFIIAGTAVVSNVTGSDAWLVKLALTGAPDLTQPTTVDNYDGLWHGDDLTINLVATDDISGVAETYYRINNEPIKTVSANNQPVITTEGAHNVLEYWSVDNSGNVEFPHKVVTDIKLDKTLPRADAGADQTVDEDTAVMLNGSASHDENGIISYFWTFTDVTPQLLNGKNPTYTFATPGNYTVMLKVLDIARNYGIDTVTITVLDVTKPVANAGQDRTVKPGETVTFDASASTDNVGIVSYEWDFGDGTTGAGKITTHLYVNETIYSVTLTVKDSAGNTATHSIAITVSSRNPVEAFYPWIVGGLVAIIAIIAAAIVLRRRHGPPRK